MKKELGQVDADLKGLFVDSKIDEMMELLNDQPDVIVNEITEYNWNIIKKYFDTENFDLLFGHLKFVAYTCFMVEYTHQLGLIEDDEFGIMMIIYNDIYEMKRQKN